MKNLHVGIFGKTIKTEHISDFERLISGLKQRGITACFYEPFANQCCKQGLIEKSAISTFSSLEELKQSCNFLISLGGDGTLLNAVSLLENSEIPVVGLNFGKLGFLASIDTHFLDEALEDLCSENYEIEHRSLLKLQANSDVPNPFALNDITFKSEIFGMLGIEVFIDGHFLNTYFGDGLIVSTPTGSTAYNLSCGGPVLLPENRNFILTPIASHTLTVRPLVIPDSSKIEVKIIGSNPHFHATLDSRRFTYHNKQTFLIEKAPFSIHTIRLKNRHFFDTIRTKLIWGQHARKN
jgi:NAD+ kinase